MHRQQPTERGAAEASAGGTGERFVLPVDERLDLLDDHAAILVGLAPSLLRHLRRRVLVDAVLAGIVDADNDQWLDLPTLDQRLRCLVDVPLLADRRRLVEDVL